MLVTSRGRGWNRSKGNAREWCMLGMSKGRGWNRAIGKARECSMLDVGRDMMVGVGGGGCDES